MTSTTGGIAASGRNRAAAILSGLVVVLGLLVLAGWHTQNLRLIQVYPGFTRMAYNTAVSFVLLGGALLALGRGFRVLARLGAAAAGVLVILPLVEYGSGLSLGALTLLARFTLRAGTMQAVPVAPNTAMTILSLAVAILLLSGARGSTWRSAVVALLASAVLSLGVNAFAGYLTGFNTFAWGQFTPMAIHTSIGVIFLGAGVLALSWPCTAGNDGNRTLWLLPVVASAGVITSVSFWRALESVERAYIAPALHGRSGMPETVLIFGLLMTALLGAAVYLAERVRFQRDLAERAERDRQKTDEMCSYLASIVDSSGDAIIGEGLDGTILSWNPGAEKLYGYSAEEIVRHPISMLCPPDRADEPIEIIQRIGRGEKVERYETERVRKDGLPVQLSLTVSPIRERDGRITGVSTIARDVTDRKRAEEALKASEALLRNVIDSSTDYIFVKDRELRTVLCNQTFARALGKSTEEVCGKTDIENGWDPELIQGNPAKGIQGWEEDDRAALRGETVHAGGEPGNVGAEIRVFETVKSPIRDAKGEIAGLVGVSRDVTERKQAEAAQQASDIAFRALADAVPQIVWICTPDGLNVYFNQRWVDYTGLTLVESYGRGWDTPFHPDDKQAAWAAWNHATETGEMYCIESRLRAADGSYRWYLMRGVPLCDAAGRIVKWFGTCTEIHDLKREEETLRKLNEKLRQASAYNRILIEASLDPLVTIAPDGKITDVNQATEQATGLARQALIGTDFCDYFTDRERARAGYQRVFQEGWTQDYDLEIRHRDGSTIPVLYNASLYRNAAGEIEGVFAAARDITERKRVEGELKELNASLERRVAERTADLVAVNQELESFNYSISHDLRAPLRHIDGFSKILAEEHGPEIPDAARRYLDLIRKGARRMGRMVDELLELSRMSRKELVRQPTGVKSLVDEVLAELMPELEGREIVWRIGELPFVDCDPNLTRQVFANLLSNAVKFSRPRRPAVIEVGQSLRQDQTVLFVRDNGVGFSAKYADKLFGVFQRLHRQEDFEGTGVGLATVQRIVHKHGGRIWAEAELNQGATFYFTLEPPGKPHCGSEKEEAAVLAGGR
ncbi:MAG: PAS domain S-box protein [Acidobacteriia bacterium]|nr:PAS domain S-box protein [Terriglobia bacterium]